MNDRAHDAAEQDSVLPLNLLLIEFPDAHAESGPSIEQPPRRYLPVGPLLALLDGL